MSGRAAERFAVVTASDDRSARIWNATTGELIGEPLWHERAVIGAVFNSDATRILTASLDGTARLRGTLDRDDSAIVLKHGDAVRAAIFAPGERRIATASQDHTARIWDTETGTAIGLPFSHEDSVQSIVFNKDGTRLLTTALDGTARVWDAGPREDVPAWFLEFAERFTGWKIADDGKPMHLPTREIPPLPNTREDAWTRLAARLLAQPKA